MRSLIAPNAATKPLCNALSPLVLAALCLPYAIRLVQCIIVYRTTGNKAQVGVAGK